MKEPFECDFLADLVLFLPLQQGKIIPLSVKVGDFVLLPEYGGSQIKTDEEEAEYLLFREAELVAKIEK